MRRSAEKLEGGAGEETWPFMLNTFFVTKKDCVKAGPGAQVGVKAFNSLSPYRIKESLGQFETCE